jgi:hypothetical protein
MRRFGRGDKSLDALPAASMDGSERASSSADELSMLHSAGRLKQLEEQVATLARSAQANFEDLGISKTEFTFKPSCQRTQLFEGGQEGSMERLRERVAQLTDHVESSVATLHLKVGAQSTQRRSTVTELMARQVQQLTNELKEKTAAMQELEQASGRFVERQVVFMLLLTYADLVSDIVLAILLLLGSADQMVYGIVSVCILGTSLVVQVLLVKFMGKKPWCSKDVLLAALYFGPALEAYRDFNGHLPSPVRVMPECCSVL